MKDVLTALGEGVQAHELTILQALARAVIVFFATLVIVRMADKRFFAKKTAFDLILGFILASMMARAINGSEQLCTTLPAGFALALLHRCLGWLACAWPLLSGGLKGHSATLITNGVPDRQTLRDHRIGDDDLMEELRLNGVEHPSEVKLARLERSGDISVVRQTKE